MTKELWIGTFHALFARMLRYDIDKFKDAEGLNLDQAVFDLRRGRRPEPGEGDRDPGTAAGSQAVRAQEDRWAISNAKNQGWLPDQLEANAEGQRGKLTADVYRRYRKALAANNALDFDDLLLLPVQLLQQNEQVRSYWHRRFRMCWWMNTRTPTAPSTT